MIAFDAPEFVGGPFDGKTDLVVPTGTNGTPLPVIVAVLVSWPTSNGPVVAKKYRYEAQPSLRDDGALWQMHVVSVDEGED